MQSNVAVVLRRFKQFNVIVNKPKCTIDKPQLDNVLGYQIDGTGQTLQTKAEFITFMGLAVYFKAHVPDVSTTRKEFAQVLSVAGSRHTKLTWTAQQILAWEKLKLDVFNCSKLFYRDSFVLETDHRNLIFMQMSHAPKMTR